MNGIVKSVSKFVPTSKGVVQNSVSGIGADQLLKIVDNMIGSPMQSFGITLPILGRVSVVDGLNYLVHNKGKLMPDKSFNGIIAVGSAKLVQTGFNFTGRFSAQNTQSPTASSGPTGGGI